MSLRTLGGLALLRDGQVLEGASAQRKRLILLALVATYHRGSGISRDRILGLLWPESDQTHARNALNQAMFGLRKDLGDDAIVGSAELRLDSRMVSCDAAMFWHASAMGDADAVVGSYAGPFLDGVFIAGTPELNEWIERTRGAMDGVFRDALRTLAHRADAENDGAAITLWQRLAAATPLDATVACSLMRALAANGDRAGAVAHARVYTALASAELGIDPNPGVSALAREIALEPDRLPPKVLQDIRPPPDPPAEHSDVIVSAASVQDAPVRRGMGRRLNTSRAPVIGALAIVTMVLGFVVRRAQPNASSLAIVAAHRETVVFPFQVDIADSSLTFLGEGLADLLSAALAQQGNAVPADAHSLAAAWLAASAEPGSRAVIAARATKRVDAAQAILGTVVGNRNHISISAEIISSDGKILGQVARTSGPPDSLLAIVDRLASSLLAGQATGDARQLADLTTRSPAALRQYLLALSALRIGHRDAAVTAFHAALLSDSSFALAALGIATSGGWTQRTLAERLKYGFSLGWRLRNELAPPERSLFDAAVGKYNPADDSDVDNLARWASAARSAPDRADVVYEYGDRLFHTGSYLGVPNALDKAQRAFSYAVKTDSTQLFALGHLAEMAIMRGDVATARHYYRAYVARDTSGDAASYLTWRLGIAAGDSLSVSAIRSRFEQLPSGTLRRIVGISQLEGVGIGDARRAIAVLLAREQNETEHALTLYRLHAFDLNTGNAAASARALDALASAWGQSSADASALGDALDLTILDALFSIGDTTRAARAVARLGAARGAAAGVALRHLCSTEMWFVGHGDTLHTLATIRQMGATSTAVDSAAFYGWQPTICLAGVTAELSLARASPQAREDVLRLDSLMATGPRGFGYTFGDLWAARMLLRINEPALALSAATRRRADWDETLYLSDMDVIALQLMRGTNDATRRALLDARLRALRGASALTRVH